MPSEGMDRIAVLQGTLDLIVLRTLHSMGQMHAYAGTLGTGRVVPGIAVFNSSAADAAAKIKGALALGYRTLALYSYDSLDERPGYWDALTGFLGLRPAAAAEVR